MCAIQAPIFFGIVVNPVSAGHLTSLLPPQNGHVTPCGISFARLYGPDTVKVFRHLVQVMIFSTLPRLLRALCRIRDDLSGPLFRHNSSWAYSSPFPMLPVQVAGEGRALNSLS